MGGGGDCVGGRPGTWGKMVWGQGFGAVLEELKATVSRMVSEVHGRAPSSLLEPRPGVSAPSSGRPRNCTHPGSALAPLLPLARPQWMPKPRRDSPLCLGSQNGFLFLKGSAPRTWARPQGGLASSLGLRLCLEVAEAAVPGAAQRAGLPGARG